MQMADSWGTKSSTLEVGSNSFRIDGFEFGTAAMAVWRKVKSEFEIFQATDSFLRPIAGSKSDFIRVLIGTEVADGEGRDFNVMGNVFSIGGPNTPAPGDRAFIAWNADWYVEDAVQLWAVGQVVEVETDLEITTEFPTPCIVSFGNLIDY